MGTGLLDGAEHQVGIGAARIGKDGALGQARGFVSIPFIQSELRLQCEDFSPARVQALGVFDGAMRLAEDAAPFKGACLGNELGISPLGG